MRTVRKMEQIVTMTAMNKTVKTTIVTMIHARTVLDAIFMDATMFYVEGQQTGVTVFLLLPTLTK